LTHISRFLSLLAQMAERRGVVVTEDMIIEAARVGDLRSLTDWARQGVRVTTAEPLYYAANGSFPAVARLLVQRMGADFSEVDLYGLAYEDAPFFVAAAQRDNTAMVQCLAELGADVNLALRDGSTPLMVAAREANLGMVRCLVQLGAEIEAVDFDGNTALILSARGGHYATMHYLLEEANADMDDVNTHGETAWDLLVERLEDSADDDHGEDEHALAVLRVLVLRGAPPPALVALLSPEPARVVQEGARLRARLPAYLVHRRTYLDSRCPRISLLPGVLRALIYTFEGPATTEELWATGLGQAK
jgi:hypothetical protein